MATNSNTAGHQTQQHQNAVTLTDHVIESLKPALVFKNFVSDYLQFSFSWQVLPMQKNNN